MWRLHDLLLPIQLLKECYPTERCVRFRATMLKSLFPIFMTMLALFVGWWFYPIQPESKRWATITELHGEWDSREQLLRISLKIEKRAECRRVTVAKHLSPLTKNTVVATNPVPFNGGLGEKLTELELGTFTVFDRAKPIGGQKIESDQYQLTLSATCEPWDDDPNALPASARTTIPVEQIVIVRGSLPRRGDVAKTEPRFS